MCCNVCHGQRHSHRECRARWFGVAHFNPHRIDGHGVRSRWGCGDLQLGRIRFGACHGFRGQQPYEPFWKPADFPVLFVHKLADKNPAKGPGFGQQHDDDRRTFANLQPSAEFQVLHPRQPCRWRRLQRRPQDDDRHGQRRSFRGASSQWRRHGGGQHPVACDLGCRRNRWQRRQLQLGGHLPQHGWGVHVPHVARGWNAQRRQRIGVGAQRHDVPCKGQSESEQQRLF